MSIYNVNFPDKIYRITSFRKMIKLIRINKYGLEQVK